MATIAHLVAEQVRWRIVCKNCEREVHLSPDQLAAMFRPDEDERDARQRLKCKRCFVRGENYLYATVGKSYDPGKGRDPGSAYAGVYGPKP